MEFFLSRKTYHDEVGEIYLELYLTPSLGNWDGRLELMSPTFSFNFVTVSAAMVSPLLATAVHEAKVGPDFQPDEPEAMYCQVWVNKYKKVRESSRSVCVDL